MIRWERIISEDVNKDEKRWGRERMKKRKEDDKWWGLEKKIKRMRMTKKGKEWGW